MRERDEKARQAQQQQQAVAAAAKLSQQQQVPPNPPPPPPGVPSPTQQAQHQSFAMQGRGWEVKAPAPPARSSSAPAQRQQVAPQTVSGILGFGVASQPQQQQQLNMRPPVNYPSPTSSPLKASSASSPPHGGHQQQVHHSPSELGGHQHSVSLSRPLSPEHPALSIYRHQQLQALLARISSTTPLR